MSLTRCPASLRSQPARSSCGRAALLSDRSERDASQALLLRPEAPWSQVTRAGSLPPGPLLGMKAEGWMSVLRSGWGGAQWGKRLGPHSGDPRALPQGSEAQVWPASGNRGEDEGQASLEG